MVTLSCIHVLYCKELKQEDVLFGMLLQGVGGPMCGNGFIEGDEECDCGTVAVSCIEQIV